MEFDIDKFAKEFKTTINWILRDRYGKRIIQDLHSLKKIKNRLKKNPDAFALDALRKIIGLIVTGGARLKEPKNFDSKIKSFIKRYGTNFRLPSAKEELTSLVGNVGRKKKNVEKLLINYSTIKQFSETLYSLAQQGKTDVLGKKGRDTYLREFGYWDRIPIDRHEKRFMIRTGIYHSCGNKGLEEGDLHDALTRFCSQYLTSYVVEGIDLGENPGIVDIFIWNYCGIDTYNICGNTPQCKQCKLNRACLYSLIHSHSPSGN